MGKRVTWTHGRRFAQTFIRVAMESEIISHAFSDSEVMVWPVDEEGQQRYHEIREEIVERTLATSTAALAEAFVAAATEVLNREQDRPK